MFEVNVILKRREKTSPEDFSAPVEKRVNKREKEVKVGKRLGTISHSYAYVFEMSNLPFEESGGS